MKEGRRKKVMQFVSGRVRSGVCSCCKHPRLIVIKIYKKYLCLKCMENIVEMFGMPVTHISQTKAHKRPVADFSKAELAEMSSGTILAKHKNNHKRNGKFIMDGGIPVRVGGGQRGDPNLQWIDPGTADTIEDNDSPEEGDFDNE